MQETSVISLIERFFFGEDLALPPHLTDADFTHLRSVLIPELASRLASDTDLMRRLETALHPEARTDSPVPTQGVLIAIEGIDGAGKGTQSQLLQKAATDAGLRVALTSFPRYGKTTFAKVVADYLNGKFGTIDTVPAHFSAFLFAGDRFETQKDLTEGLANHDLLISDRYVASNVAYHASRIPAEHQDGFLDWLFSLEYQTFGLPIPKVNVHLDVPVSIASEWVLKKAPRSYTESKADIHERRVDYLDKCRAIFIRLGQRSDPYGEWCRIDVAPLATSSDSRLVVAEKVWQEIRPFIPKAV